MTESYDLRRGDDDAERKWGGAVRSPSAPGTVGDNQNAAFADVAPVRDMQRNLRRVGILLGPEPNGTFDLPTEWSVREFQIYAKMERVAKEDAASTAPEYVDRLSAVPTGTARYAGPVSGVYNAATRAAMAHWLAQSWRCPVVLDAWKAPKKGAPEERVARNIWVYNQDVAGGTVKAVDFSSHYFVPDPQPWRLGTRVFYKVRGDHGPAAGIEDGWSSVEVLPESLLGRSWPALTPDEQSTFRVVRAVSEVECRGFFDVGNGYDAGVESTGIFHFIVALLGDGELAGLLDRLATENAGDYERGIRFFGVDVTRVDPKKGKPRFKLCNDAGAYVEPIFDGAAKNTTTAAYRAEIDYFRGWHWFYRLGMLERTTPTFRLQQWREAMDRLRVIRAKRIEADFVTPIDATKDPPQLATIGDTFTSELSMGYILRWHVNWPQDVVGPRGKKNEKKVHGLGQGLVDALAEAKRSQPGLAWSSPPTKWTDREEEALHLAIRKVDKRPTVQNSLPFIEVPEKQKRWALDRNVVGLLSKSRGSFKMAAPPPTPGPPAPSAPSGPPAPAPPSPSPSPTPGSSQEL